MPANHNEDVLGTVLDVTGDRALCRLSLAALEKPRQVASPGWHANASVGGLVKIEVLDRLVICSIVDLKSDREDDGAAYADLEFIGEGARAADGNLAGFNRGVTHYPHPGNILRFVASADLQQIFSPHDTPHIHIGMVYPTDDIRAPILFDKLLSRHFALVGATGAGKSTLVALLLDRIIEVAPESHIVILDPHGEYARAFGPAAKVWNADNLQIPYWLMSHQEHCDAFVSSAGEGRGVEENILSKCLVAARTRLNWSHTASKITADSPLPYGIDDLLDALMDEAGHLEKEAEPHHYTRLKLNIERLFADPRYRFIFRAEYYRNSMATLIGELTRVPVAGQPISIIDLAGMPSKIVEVIVSILSRLVLDCAVWTPQEQRVPILLICEEAQRYLPNAHGGAATSAQLQLDRIAREGRKYGVSLGIVAQRPAELSETALSQCGTIISMRLNNEADQQRIRSVLFEGARSFVDEIQVLQNRECIVSGEGVPAPMRVRIDTLANEQTPASDDPAFSLRWASETSSAEVIADAVRRWSGG